MADKEFYISNNGDDEGSGGYTSPFKTLKKAAEVVSPGDVIIIKDGEYNEDTVVFEKSGTAESPIRVRPENKFGAVINGTSLVFKGVNDYSVSGLVFHDTEKPAVSVIGDSARNVFSSLILVDCGKRSDISCSVFFGSDRGEYNVLEFSSLKYHSDKRGSDSLPIGVMVGTGIAEEGEGGNRRSVLNGNTFDGYSNGMVLGSAPSGLRYSHTVEQNFIRNCTDNGILSLCGTSNIRDNLIIRCRKHGIYAKDGNSYNIENNRITLCGIGIKAAGDDIAVRNNCISDFSGSGIEVEECKIPDPKIFIEQNTFALKIRRSVPALNLNKQLFSFLQHNIFYRCSLFSEDGAYTGASGNVCYDVHAEGDHSGIFQKSIRFVSVDRGNYVNETKYGASGWAASGSFSINTETLDVAEDLEEAFYNDSLLGGGSSNQAEYLNILRKDTTEKD